MNAKIKTAWLWIQMLIPVAFFIGLCVFLFFFASPAIGISFFIAPIAIMLLILLKDYIEEKFPKLYSLLFVLVLSVAAVFIAWAAISKISSLGADCEVTGGRFDTC